MRQQNSTLRFLYRSKAALVALVRNMPGYWHYPNSERKAKMLYSCQLEEDSWTP